MISIIFAVILGIGFTFLASQNPTTIAFTFLGITYALPFYLFAGMTFLGGMFVAYVFHLLDSATIAMDIHSKNVRLREIASTNTTLRSDLDKLRRENTQLREELHSVHTKLQDEKIENTKQNVQNFFGRIRHNLSH